MTTKGLFVLLGPPGAGKGSISSLCVKHLGWYQLSTGNLCRQEIVRGTKIGKQIDFALKSGKLIADSLITQMLDKTLREIMPLYSGIILDGFPRTVPQAKELDKVLEWQTNLKLTFVRVSASDKTVMERLANRLICSSVECQAVYSKTAHNKQDMLCLCGAELMVRADDKEEVVIKERLAQYHANEQLLIDYYQKKENFNFYELSAEKPLQDIFKEFKSVVGIK